MSRRNSNTLVICLIGLLFSSPVVLFAQQAAEGPLSAGQPGTKSENDVSKLFLGVKIRQRIESELGGLQHLRFAAATYGNQVGVEIAELEGALRTQLGIEDGIGVLVTGVSPESEAAKAGLAQHDLILKINEQTISGPQQFNDLMGAMQGKAVQFHILHKGKPVAVAVILPKSPVYELLGEAVRVNEGDLVKQLPTVSSALVARLALDSVAVERQYRIGVTLAEADDVLRSQLRLAAGEGLVVTDIVADSPAAKAGIQRHDVLTKLDGKRLTAIEAATAHIQEIKDRAVPVALYRAGVEQVLTVTPQLTDENSYRLSVVRHFNDLARVRWVAEAELADLTGAIEKAVSPESTARPPAAAQLADLKKQLAELQKAVEGLEATLQSESANKQPPPAEKK